MKNRSILALLIVSLGCSSLSYSKVVVALTPLTSPDGLVVEQTAISMIMEAELSQATNITLVERKQIGQALNELKLGQQGLLDGESARQMGKIVGARYYCSGTVNSAGNKEMAVVRVIDVETTLTKVGYVFLKNKDDAGEAGKTLSGQVLTIVAQFEAERIEREKKAMNGESQLSAKVIPADWKRPTVMVIIRESHVARETPLLPSRIIDPAGETEVIKRLLAENFKVVDSEYVQVMKTDEVRGTRLFGSLKTSTRYAADKKVDVLIYGEALSERGAVLGDFEGCRGRIELKAVKVRTDEVLLADSAEGGATDLAESVAGKKAIQQAANRLADRFLYKLAEKWIKAQ